MLTQGLCGVDQGAGPGGTDMAHGDHPVLHGEASVPPPRLGGVVLGDVDDHVRLEAADGALTAFDPDRQPLGALVLPVLPAQGSCRCHQRKMTEGCDTTPTRRPTVYAADASHIATNSSCTRRSGVNSG